MNTSETKSDCKDDYSQRLFRFYQKLSSEQISLLANAFHKIAQMLQKEQSVTIADGILVQFYQVKADKEVMVKAEKMKSIACGVADQKIPPPIAIPGDVLFCKGGMALKFNFEPYQNFVSMEIQGGDGPTRSQLEIQIFYQDYDEPEVFLGKDRKRGGAWQIPIDKAQKINRICFKILGK